MIEIIGDTIKIREATRKGYAEIELEQKERKKERCGVGYGFELSEEQTSPWKSTRWWADMSYHNNNRRFIRDREIKRIYEESKD